MEGLLSTGPTPSSSTAKYLLLADPGKARGCFTITSVTHWFIHSFSNPLLPTALRRRHTQTVRDSTSSYKIDHVIVISKSWRASKWHHWFTSYGHFTEAVDFAYWWSCIWKGLRLQPAQQACFCVYGISVNKKNTELAYRTLQCKGKWRWRWKQRIWLLWSCNTGLQVGKTNTLYQSHRIYYTGFL